MNQRHEHPARTRDGGTVVTWLAAEDDSVQVVPA